MPRACPNCKGDLDLSLHAGEARCAHGDAVDRAFRALDWLEAERGAAAERKKHRLPANLQKAGDAFERSAKREGVSATYVRGLHKIITSDDERREKLLDAVRARAMRIDEAARELTAAGEPDDTDTWLTPKHIYAPALREAGGCFGLDPATIASNPTNAREWYARQAGDDGLNLSWTHDRNGRMIRTIWVNPPYSNTIAWLERAIATVNECPKMRIWVLIPSTTDTVYGQYAISQASTVCFLDKRVKHAKANGEKPGSPRWGSMVVGFGAATCEHYRDLGVVLAGGAATAMGEAV